MTYMPGAVQGKNWKLSRPFYGPYRILSLTPTNAEIHLVDKPSDPAIFVSLNRLRPCYSELSDISWSGKSKQHRKKQCLTKLSPMLTVKHHTLTVLLFPIRTDVSRDLTRKK